MPFVDLCPSSGKLATEQLSVISLQRPCKGAVVARVSDLPPLRFCTIISGNLSLVMSDSTAVDSDYNVFASLEEIKGESHRCSAPRDDGWLVA